MIIALTAAVALIAGASGCAARPAAPAHKDSYRLRAAGTDRSAPLPAPVPCPSCWRPPLRESWQIQIDQPPVPPFPQVAMIETDGFDTSTATVAALHRTGRGRAVVCYIDAGTWESWRPDAGQFPRALLGRADGGWPGERWLDIARLDGALARIMRARTLMCARKRFSAVDFDNVDGYDNDTGFRLTARDQLRYDVFLANSAHRLGLAVALKNDLPQIPVLLPYFDFAVDEQCFQYDECSTAQNGGFGLDEFTRAGKAVFEIEYQLRRVQFCRAAVRDHFNALRKHLSLGSWREPCPLPAPLGRRA